MRLVHQLAVDPSWPPVEWYAQGLLLYSTGILAIPEVFRFTWG